MRTGRVSVRGSWRESERSSGRENATERERKRWKEIERIGEVQLRCASHAATKSRAHATCIDPLVRTRIHKINAYNYTHTHTHTHT